MADFATAPTLNDARRILEERGELTLGIPPGGVFKTAAISERERHFLNERWRGIIGKAFNDVVVIETAFENLTLSETQEEVLHTIAEQGDADQLQAFKERMVLQAQAQGQL